MIGVIRSNFWTIWRKPIKWPFILFVLKSRKLMIGVIRSNFWTSWRKTTKWPFILLVLKSRKDWRYFLYFFNQLTSTYKVLLRNLKFQSFQKLRNFSTQTHVRWPEAPLVPWLWRTSCKPVCTPSIASTFCISSSASALLLLLISVNKKQSSYLSPLLSPKCHYIREGY